MKADRIIRQIFLWIFLISIPSTFMFWTLLSDSDGYDEETEKAFGKIINTAFEEGDIIFPQIDWDLNFLKYLDHGITTVYLTLKETSAKDLKYMKEDGGKVFLLLKDDDQWEDISQRLNLSEISRKQAGHGLVIIASDGTEKNRKKLLFARDIGKAEEVYFEKDDRKEPCTKTSDTRWQCGKADWNYVGATVASMMGRQQRTVWAHPRSKKTLHIKYKVPADAEKLVLNTAFLSAAVSSSNKSPVEVTVSFDGKKVLSYTNKSISKIYGNEVKITENTEEIDISFYVEHDGQRHFVFNGYID